MNRVNYGKAVQKKLHEKTEELVSAAQAKEEDHEAIEAMKNFKGIFGMGLSTNPFLDLLNLLVLGITGIIITFCFKENFTRGGESGPARTTIWGYSLTAISVAILLFISLGININSNKIDNNNSKQNIDNEFILFKILGYIINSSLPILILFGLLIYIIYLNFKFYNKINAKNVGDSYYQYFNYSSIIFILSLIIIFKYMHNLVSEHMTKIKNEKNEKNSKLIQSISLVLSTINLIFIFMMHIVLAFYSTDG